MTGAILINQVSITGFTYQTYSSKALIRVLLPNILSFAKHEAIGLVGHSKLE